VRPVALLEVWEGKNGEVQGRASWSGCSGDWSGGGGGWRRMEWWGGGGGGGRGMVGGGGWGI
jgi:hypothetical protein